jgi:hypothetical protein
MDIDGENETGGDGNSDYNANPLADAPKKSGRSQARGLRGTPSSTV